MYTEFALRIHDDCSVNSLRSAIELLDLAAPVIVGRSGGTAGSLHVFDVGSLIAMLVDAPGDQLLDDALGLDQLPSSRVHVFGSGAVPRPGDVVLFSAGTAGLVMAEGSDRGIGGPPGIGESVPVVAPSPAGRAAEAVRFRAYPAVYGPSSAKPGEEFTVRVGFSADDADDPGALPVIVADAPKTPTFVVQVGGFGLAFPDGIRKEFTVDRDAPETASVSFRVVPQPVRRGITRTVEVSFTYEGELVGHAWHEVRVTAEDVGPFESQRLVASGGTGVQVPGEVDAPDLTVEIRSDGSAQLEWVFHTRHGVTGPATQVVSSVDAASAEAFATQLMSQLPLAKGTPGLFATVRGMGRIVGRVVPTQFWEVLEATWRAVGPGQTPSLLLTTSEPFVPWELVWVDEENVDSALMPPGVEEAPLGTLWRMGRWVPPRHAHRGPGRPVSPPEHAIDVRSVAVVVGDYSGDRKVADLPLAIEEGHELVEDFRDLSLDAMPLTATDAGVTALLNPPDGDASNPRPCDALHFAAHGQVSTQQQQYTGILLAGGRRLDLLAVEGSTIGQVTAPIVFLNACQVGTAGRMLSTYGGLAGAFLSTGCRGFVAPLWNVDDDVAKEVALTFYSEVLKGGAPVGGALRRVRQGFGRGEGGSATPLAYVFYGHPNLRLRRPGPSGDGDPDPTAP